MTALVPDSGPGPFPVFYLLHGITGDSTAWLRRGSIERYMTEWTATYPDGIPMIVVSLKEIVKLLIKHRERMAMIEHGMDPDAFRRQSRPIETASDETVAVNDLSK